MASTTDARFSGTAPKTESKSFRPSMLLNDSRYRGYTLQVITVLILVAAVWWLGNNVVQKFADQGKTFSFDFLWQPAGYDIDQPLIDYTSRSPHGVAAIAGIMNTFLVAILGIIGATIIGVAVGVARLSQNWLVARLMTVYVEVTRNIPLLIWIVLAIAIFTTVFPSPRQAWTLGGGLGSFVELITFGIYSGEPIGQGAVFTNRGIQFTAPDFLPGSGVVVAVFFLSLLAAYFVRRYAMKRKMETGHLFPWVRVSLLVVIVPTLLAYFLMGRPIGLDVPELAGFNYEGGARMSGALFALWFALTTYTAGFIAEVVRAGIQAVSKGQREAAGALGLPQKRIMNLVVLPQALRMIIPPLISQYLNLTKNSSLAIATGYFDITGTLGGITLNQTGREMECLLLLMAFYLTVSLTISGLMNVYNSRVALQER